MSRPRCRCPYSLGLIVSVVLRRPRDLYEVAMRVVAEYVAGTIVRSPHRASRNVHALPVECAKHAIEIFHQQCHVSSGWPGMLFCQQKVDLGLATVVVCGPVSAIRGGHWLQAEESLVKPPSCIQISHHQADV